MSMTVLQFYYYLGILSVIYWLASFAVLLLKSKSEKFRQLTLYGGRATQPPAPPDPAKVKREAARRAQLAKYHSRFSSHRIGRAVAEVGRRSVPRKWAFVGFYVTGLVISLLLYVSTPVPPCEEAAQTSAWKLVYKKYEEDIRKAKPSTVEMNRLSFGSTSSIASGLHRVLRIQPSQENVGQLYKAYRDNRKYCFEYVAPFASLEFLPLGLFALHCAVRLAECLFVHRFVGGAADRTTLFAAVSGCSFYAFAALSCHVGLFAGVRHDYLRRKLSQSGILLPASSPLGSERGEQFLIKLFPSDFKTVLGQHIAKRDSWLWSHFLDYDYGRPLHRQRDLGFTILGALGHLMWWLPFVLVTVSTFAFLVAQVMQVRLHHILATLRDPPKEGDTSKAARRQSSLTQEVIQFALFKLQSRTTAAVRTMEKGAAIEKQKKQQQLQQQEVAQVGSHMTSTMRQRRPAAAAEESDAAANKTDVPTSFAAFKARKDQEKRAVGDDADEGEEEEEDPSAALRALGEDRRMWYYSYPLVSQFQYVLEPHYTCEILLYVFNGIMIVVLVLGGSLMAPAAQHPMWNLMPFFVDAPYPTFYHDTFTFLLVQIVSITGVICFTTVNLGVTAKEHRTFWKDLNVERSMVLTLLAGEDTEETASSLSETNPLVKKHNANNNSSHTKSIIDVQLGDDEEHQRVRYQKHLDFLLSPEIIPPYNLFNNMW